MPIFTVYRDFLSFLAELAKGGMPWGLHQEHYLNQHKDFLFAYWHNFTRMDLEQVRARVERIRVADYSTLRSLVQGERPEEIVSDSLRKCQEVFPAPEEPRVYLIVGFFSSEGFVLQYEGKSCIGIGLERFTDFRSLGLIFAHEYCHYLRSLLRKEKGPADRRNLEDALISEGLCGLFSQLVFPERPLYEHLLIPRARLNWCISNEDYLKSLIKSELDSPRLVHVLFKAGSEELGVPPRAGHYLGYWLLKEHQARSRATLSQLLELDRLP